MQILIRIPMPPSQAAGVLILVVGDFDRPASQLMDHLEGESRYALLGISNSIMMAEITANRVLDRIDLSK
nr:hypothetical protein [uncultured Pseudomonas sp.]